MAYSVVFANGNRRTGISGLEIVVYLHASLRARIGAFDYAVSSSAFDFYTKDGRAIKSLTLTTAALSGAPVGGDVLMDDTTGKWRFAQVTNDGSSAAVGGEIVSGNARAAIPLTDNSQSVADAAYTLVGTAASGLAWFESVKPAGRTVVCAAMTTAAAVGSGGVALVEQGGYFYLTRL